MGTTDRRHRTERLRGSLHWRVAVAAAAGVAIVGIGVGMAHAEGNTARDQALRGAAARAAHMPSAKASIFMAGVRGAFPTHPATKPTSTAMPSNLDLPPVKDEPAPRVTGISNLKQAPFGSEDFLVKNAYYGMVGNRWYGVYLGTVGNISPQAKGEGGVYILSTDAKTNTHWRNLGPFPQAGTTWLEVTASSGTELTLVSNTGATYTFDLATLKYR